MGPEFFAPPFVTRIPRSGKHRNVSEQTTRDNERLVERMRRCAATFQSIERILDGVAGKRTMSQLITVADECALRDPSLLPPDRLARRSRSGLLCWFCENWAAVSPFVMLRFKIPCRGAAPAPSEQKDDELADGKIHPLSVVALLNH
jgi:hypothetical protein